MSKPGRLSVTDVLSRRQRLLAGLSVAAFMIAAAPAVAQTSGPTAYYNGVAVIGDPVVINLNALDKLGPPPNMQQLLRQPAVAVGAGSPVTQRGAVLSGQPPVSGLTANAPQLVQAAPSAAPRSGLVPGTRLSPNTVATAARPAPQTAAPAPRPAAVAAATPAPAARAPAPAPATPRVAAPPPPQPAQPSPAPAPVAAPKASEPTVAAVRPAPPPPPAPVAAAPKPAAVAAKPAPAPAKPQPAPVAATPKPTPVPVPATPKPAPVAVAAAPVPATPAIAPPPSENSAGKVEIPKIQAPTVAAGQTPTPVPVPVPAASAPAPAPAQVAALNPDAVIESADQVTIKFASASSELPGGASPALDRLAEQLAASPDLRIVLKGYASNEGESASQSRRLSLFRALSVRTYLIKQGVRSTRMDVRALGNKVDSGDANRVDVILPQSAG